MKWNFIKDKAPKNGQQVIFYFKHIGFSIGNYRHNTRADNNFIAEHVFYDGNGFLGDEDVYWMDMPELPKEIK